MYQNHSRVLNNGHNTYPNMCVIRPLDPVQLSGTVYLCIGARYYVQTRFELCGQPQHD